MGPYPYGNAYPSVGASLVAQSVKNLPTVQETWVRSPGWEDPLEKWQPTPVSLPRKSHGQKSLVGCSPWGRKESGTTEWLTLTYSKYLCSFCGLFFFFFLPLVLKIPHTSKVNRLAHFPLIHYICFQKFLIFVCHLISDLHVHGINIWRNSVKNWVASV